MNGKKVKKTMWPIFTLGMFACVVVFLFSAMADIKVDGAIQGDTCYLCGKHGLIGYYSQLDSIGILNLNTGQIVDVKLIDDELDESASSKNKGSSTRWVSGGETDSTIFITVDKSRRLGHITVEYFEDSQVNEEELSNLFCEKCIIEIHEIYAEQSYERIRDCVFVDFTDRKLYPINSRYKAYFIRDYYLHFDFGKDRVEILTVYLPPIEE